MKLHSVLVTGAPARVSWAVGQQVTLPLGLAGFEAAAACVINERELNLPEDFVLAADPLKLRESAAFTLDKPTSSRLGVSYQLIPPRVRSFIAGSMGRVQRRRQHVWASYPQWPLDLSVDFFSDLCGQGGRFSSNSRTPVLLTHDLDDLEGLRNLVGKFLTAEERVGARSMNYVVPCKYPLDHGLLQEIAARGHGLGVHGHDHSNTTAFADQDTRRKRLQKGRDALKAYAPQGYRAPSLLRTPALLRELGSFYAHDSSIPTSGGLFPTPNNGCATARPFLFEGVVEIPLSMPRDGSLIFLGHSPQETLGLWQTCARNIAASGGVVVLLTHCENRFSGNARRFSIYLDFLEYLATSDTFYFSTPDDVVRTFWQSLGKERAADDENISRDPF